MKLIPCDCDGAACESPLGLGEQEYCCSDLALELMAPWLHPEEWVNWKWLP